MPRTRTCEALLVDLSNVLAQIQHGAPEDGNGRAESVEMSFAHKAIREARMWILEHEKLNGDVAKEVPLPPMNTFLARNKAGKVVEIVDTLHPLHVDIDPTEQLLKLGYTVNELELEQDAEGKVVVPEGYVVVARAGEEIPRSVAAAISPPPIQSQWTERWGVSMERSPEGNWIVPEGYRLVQRGDYTDLEKAAPDEQPE